MKNLIVYILLKFILVFTTLLYYKGNKSFRHHQTWGLKFFTKYSGIIPRTHPEMGRVGDPPRNSLSSQKTSHPSDTRSRSGRREQKKTPNFRSGFSVVKHLKLNMRVQQVPTRFVVPCDQPYRIFLLRSCRFSSSSVWCILLPH